MHSFQHQLLSIRAPMPAQTYPHKRAVKDDTLAAATKLSATQHIPCKFFRQGLCTAGLNCSFSHSTEAYVDPAICKYYLRGQCKFGNKCALSHILPVKLGPQRKSLLANMPSPPTSAMGVSAARPIPTSSVSSSFHRTSQGSAPIQSPLAEQLMSESSLSYMSESRYTSASVAPLPTSAPFDRYSASWSGAISSPSTKNSVWGSPFAVPSPSTSTEGRPVYFSNSLLMSVSYDPSTAAKLDVIPEDEMQLRQQSATYNGKLTTQQQQQQQKHRLRQYQYTLSDSDSDESKTSVTNTTSCFSPQLRHQQQQEKLIYHQTPFMDIPGDGPDSDEEQHNILPSSLNDLLTPTEQRRYSSQASPGVESFANAHYARKNSHTLGNVIPGQAKSLADYLHNENLIFGGSSPPITSAVAPSAKDHTHYHHHQPPTFSAAVGSQRGAYSSTLLSSSPSATRLHQNNATAFSVSTPQSFTSSHYSTYTEQGGMVKSDSALSLGLQAAAQLSGEHNRKKSLIAVDTSSPVSVSPRGTNEALEDGIMFDMESLSIDVDTGNQESVSRLHKY